jgi:HTH-type transcriptional regulator, competence development regulator
VSTVTSAPPFDNPAPDESFGTYIQRARRFRGRTQRELAADLDIDFTYLSKIENDRGDSLGEERIRRLAEALALDTETLLALAGRVPPEIRQMALDDRDFAMFLRQLPSMSPEERQSLYGRVRRRR